MEVEIISTTENKLLERKEVSAVVRFDGATPNRKDIREAVATKIGLNPDMTILNSVASEFGAKEIRITAHGYSNLKKLIEVEPEYLRKRDGVGVEKEKPKEGEAPAEAPKEEKKPEEKPKEEKKEEAPKKEEKKEEKPPEKKEEKPKEEPKKEENKEEPKKEEKPKEEKEGAKPEEKKEEKK